MRKSERILGSICLGAMITVVGYASVRLWNADKEAPVIAFEKDVITASVDEVREGDDILLQYMTAADAQDGDLTSHILVENLDKKQDGNFNEFEVNYVVFDQAGNQSKNRRTLVITDYTEPRFVCQTSLRYPKGKKVDLRGIFGVRDAYDGLISAGIVYDVSVELALGEAECGWYSCTARVRNSLGAETGLEFAVEVYDENMDDSENTAGLALTDYVIYTNLEEPFTPEAYLKNVRENGILYQIDHGDYYRFEQESGEYIPLTEEELQADSIQWTELYTEAEVLGKTGNWINAGDVEFTSEYDGTSAGSFSGTYTYVSRNTGYTTRVNVTIVAE